MAKKERVRWVCNEKNDDEGMGIIEALHVKGAVDGKTYENTQYFFRREGAYEGALVKYLLTCLRRWDDGEAVTGGGRKENKRTTTISPRGKSSSLGERQTGTPRKVQGTKNNT